MAESNERPEEESTHKAAMLLVQALEELQRRSPVSRAAEQAREELSVSRVALEKLAARFEQQIVTETEQRILLAGQLTSLATSLDRLVSHLQDLGDLMTGMLDRLNEAPRGDAVQPAIVEAPGQPSEPPFLPGGEGVSVTIAAVPGFQALMDLQKAIIALDSVAGASVERFQEGDSRVLMHLKSPLRATDLAADLRTATGHTVVVEEARPELMSLRLRIITG